MRRLGILTVGLSLALHKPAHGSREDPSNPPADAAGYVQASVLPNRAPELRDTLLDSLPLGNAAQRAGELLRQATITLQIGDPAAALRQAEKAVALDPRNPQAYYLRATAQLQVRRYKAAVEDSSRLLELDPASVAALNVRAMALNRLGEYDLAMKDALTALQREPKNALAYHNLAFAQAGFGQRPLVIESLRRAAELDSMFLAKYQAALATPARADILGLFQDRTSQEPAPQENAPSAVLRPSSWIFLAAWFGGSMATLLLFWATLVKCQKMPSPISTAHKLLARVRGKTRDAASPACRIKTGPKAAPNPGGDSVSVSRSGPFGRRYRLERVIGMGGMGIVYEALDEKLLRKVAIKQMRGEIRVVGKERDELLQEARTVAALRHPGIVEIYSVEESGPNLYLVFEYVEGRTLSKLIQENKRIGPADTARLLKGLCEALEYAHKRGVVHRDIKPSNIMVDSGGCPKIMDFGVAWRLEQAFSRTGKIYGTFRYMAPEQEQGIVRKESDLYSLAVCLYEALSGSTPFPGPREKALINKLSKRFPPVSQAGRLPRGLDAFFERALDPRPERRFPGPRELWSAFREAL